MSIFNKIVNQMVETSEELIRVVEEGTSILLGRNGQNIGEMTRFDGVSEAAGDGWGDFGDLTDDQILNEPSPLNSIAEEVLGNIIMNQVSLDKYNFFHYCSKLTLPFAS